MNFIEKLKRKWNRARGTHERTPAGQRLARMQARKISRNEAIVANVEEEGHDGFMLTIVYREDSVRKSLRLYTRRNFPIGTKVRLRLREEPWPLMETVLRNHEGQPESYLIAIPS